MVLNSDVISDIFVEALKEHRSVANIYYNKVTIIKYNYTNYMTLVKVKAAVGSYYMFYGD